MTVFMAGIAGFEHVTARHFNPLGLNLTGLTQVTPTIRQSSSRSRRARNQVRRSMYVGPEMRLIGLMGTMVYTVHIANSMTCAPLKHCAR